MRVDLYTKIVLTVIAACLLFSAFKSVFSPREATARGAQPVYVEGGWITVDGVVTIDGTVAVSNRSPEIGYKYPLYVEVIDPR